MTPHPSGMNCFSATVFSNSSALNSKSLLLGDVDLQVSRKLSLGSAEDLSHMLPALQLSEGGHGVLSSVDPGHCALGLSKGILHTCLESITGQHFVDIGDIEGVELHLDVKTIFATAFHHVLVGTNTGSLQGFRGELLILSDTMWPQSRNSSTFAFFCPTSVIIVLPPGTSRQKQKGDFGYGLFLQYW